MRHQGPLRIKDVVDWDFVIKNYLISQGIAEADQGREMMHNRENKSDEDLAKAKRKLGKVMI